MVDGDGGAWILIPLDKVFALIKIWRGTRRENFVIIIITSEIITN